MELRTRNLILSAWRENRLAALHIDLQRKYYREEEIYEDGNKYRKNSDVYESVAKVSRFLRSISLFSNRKIPNFWVAWPEEGFRDTNEEFVWAYNRDCSSWEDELSPILKANEYESVLIKNRPSCFTRTTAEGSHVDRHLRSRSKDTFFVTGVEGNCCVEDSIHAALRLGYNVVALTDCISKPHYKNFGLSRSNLSRAHIKAHFHSATSDDVMALFRGHDTVKPMELAL